MLTPCERKEKSDYKKALFTTLNISQRLLRLLTTHSLSQSFQSSKLNLFPCKMRIATILAACPTVVLAQSTAEQYPYGYWDVNVTSACTDGCVGYLKNFTIVFHDDNRIVSDEQKEYHCYSSWAADTLVETKKCDNQYLDFALAEKTIWTQTCTWLLPSCSALFSLSRLFLSFSRVS